MLEVRDITKIYNPGTLTEQRLFEHFSLTVDEGQFVAIVGSNGSGKTYICIGIGEHCYIWMDKNMKADYDAAGKTSLDRHETSLPL